MTSKTVIFLHGYATRGGLQTAKAGFLHDRLSAYAHIDFQAIDFNPTAKDFQYHTLTGMIDRLRQYILDRDLGQVSLIAISQGANVALNYSHRYGNVKRLLLLAPELFYDAYLSDEAVKKWAELVDEPVFHYGFQETIPLNYGHHQDGLRYLNPPPAPVPITLIHGLNDQAVPIEQSRKYAAQYPDKVRLIEVESNHFLDDQHDLIWKYVQEVIGVIK